jgi:hypothetical protein
MTGPMDGDPLRVSTQHLYNPDDARSLAAAMIQLAARADEEQHQAIALFLGDLISALISHAGTLEETHDKIVRDAMREWEGRAGG